MLWAAEVGGLGAGPHKEDAPSPNRELWQLAAALLMETEHSPEGADSVARGDSRGVTVGEVGGIPAASSLWGSLCQGSEVQDFSLWEEPHSERCVSVCCPDLRINPWVPMFLQNKWS